MTVPNQRGASIIEVLIMSGAMAAMMVGFMSLIGHETKSVSYLEDKLSRVALENALRMQFSNSDYCQNFLGGLAVPAKDAAKDIVGALAQGVQKKALQQIFQKRGDKTFFDQLEIGKISLEQSDLTEPNSSGTINLVFYPTRLRKGGGPPSLQPVKIRTTVTVNDKYEIQACNSNDDTKPGCFLGDLEKRFPGSVLVDWYKPQSATAMMPGNTPGASSNNPVRSTAQRALWSLTATNF